MANKTKKIDIGGKVLIASLCIWGLSHLVKGVGILKKEDTTRNLETVMGFADKDNSGDLNYSEMIDLGETLESCGITSIIYNDSIYFPCINKELRQVIEKYESDNND